MPFPKWRGNLVSRVIWFCTSFKQSPPIQCENENYHPLGAKLNQTFNFIVNVYFDLVANTSLFFSSSSWFLVHYMMRPIQNCPLALAQTESHISAMWICSHYERHESNYPQKDKWCTRCQPHLNTKRDVTFQTAVHLKDFQNVNQWYHHNIRGYSVPFLGKRRCAKFDGCRAQFSRKCLAKCQFISNISENVKCAMMPSC